MPREIPKAYEPQEIEQRWAKAWFEERLFRAENSGTGPAFSIALPPPNVTGSIHIGHMLEHTQIDMLVRWHRMKGERTLWLPGMDHAGIATQFVVERELAKEKLRRQDLGREEFERRVWKWKEESGGVIKEQMIRLGASCDWTREHFTLEPKLYRAVLEAFLRLYREGLIYRGRYMVNWCPRCQTAISDLEVVHHERTGEIWNIRYPLLGSKEHVTVATTRPETMLGDTAVAVHPEDERYRVLIGKKVLLPLVNREIPVIADTYVDREFGTGVVKITPAHDPNDFEVGKRHNLPEVDVMTLDGHMNDAAGKYAGVERFAARARIVADLKELGLLESVKEHLHAVGVCDRCKAIVEPRISTQWFMKMKPLAEEAKRAVCDGWIEVVPENQRTILLNWLENIRDWCISRQLWWGHRIPIWHCADCKEMVPARDSQVEIVEGHARAASAPTKCPKCGGANVAQDSDVLDTWFSSALWPFSTLGWPDDTPDLHAYYPTSLLISGYDILFFWDARMIMMGLRLTKGAAPKDRIPFRRLYLHSLVRTAEGAKMSKTKGTGVDPLHLTEQYGTDALRYMLASMAAPGTDIILSEDRILGARAFANKIWNAARLVMTQVSKLEETGIQVAPLFRDAWKVQPQDYGAGDLTLADKWILSRLYKTTKEVSDALQDFRFHEAAQTVYHFFWREFCDWYLEWIKPSLSPEAWKPQAWIYLITVFSASLRLLHPIMPFITEELWFRLHELCGDSSDNYRSLCFEPFAMANAAWQADLDEEDMETLQQIIVAARNIRAEMKLDPKRKVEADLSSSQPAVRQLVKENLEAVLRLATLSALTISSGALDPTGAAVRSTAQFDLRIAYGEAVDKQAEIARLKKEVERLAKDIESKQKRLADENFTGKAPAKVVEDLRRTLAERQLEYQKFQDRLNQLE